MTSKVAAHIKDFEQDTQEDGMLTHPYMLLFQCEEGWQWLAIEKDMLNRYQDKAYDTPEQAVDALYKEFGYDNVVLERYYTLELG